MNDSSAPPNPNKTLLLAAVIGVALLGGVGLATMLLQGNEQTSATATRDDDEVSALRKAQALAANEPTEANLRAWELAARKYRALRWSQP